MSDETRCARCARKTAVCVCDRAEVLPTRTRVLVLQHPQEDDVEFGTVPLLTLSLPRAQVAVGLSWASLAHAVGEPADPSRWAVLYPTKPADDVPADARQQPVLVLDRKGHVRPPTAPSLDGIVVLDGTWSQAKTLWWRNAWLLKLDRVVLTPREPSIYGRVRREPRREYVSTLEAVADVLPALGEDEAVRGSLRKLMRTMVQRARDAHDAARPPTPGR